VLIISFHFDAISQSDYRQGYIIKNNGDSLSGLVRYYPDKKSATQCDFKQTMKNKATTFLPTDLKSYGFIYDKSYESVNLKTDTIKQRQVFVKVLVKGPLALYKYQKMFLLKIFGHEGYVTLPIPVNKTVDTKEGKMIQNDRRYIDILNTYLEGAQLSANRAGYNEDDLTNLINKYNVSKGYPEHHNPAPVLKFNYEIFGGYSNSKMKMELRNEQVSFSPSVTVIGGLGLDVSSPRIFDKIYLSIQGWYVSAVHQAYTESMFVLDLVHEDIILDIDYLKFPVGIRYNFAGPNNTPYVKVGFVPTFVLSSELKTINELEYSGVITAQDEYRNYDVKNSQGLWMAIGYNKVLAKNLKLFVELRGERTNGFIGSPIQSRSLAVNYNILLGLRF
jgi:hypothetical protein